MTDLYAQREAVIRAVEAALAEVGEPLPYWDDDPDDPEQLAMFPPTDLPSDRIVQWGEVATKAANLVAGRLGWPGHLPPRKASYDG